MGAASATSTATTSSPRRVAAGNTPSGVDKPRTAKLPPPPAEMSTATREVTSRACLWEHTPQRVKTERGRHGQGNGITNAGETRVERERKKRDGAKSAPRIRSTHPQAAPSVAPLTKKQRRRHVRHESSGRKHQQSDIPIDHVHRGRPSECTVHNAQIQLPGGCGRPLGGGHCRCRRGTSVRVCCRVCQWRRRRRAGAATLVSGVGHPLWCPFKNTQHRGGGVPARARHTDDGHGSRARRGAAADAGAPSDDGPRGKGDRRHPLCPRGNNRKRL